MPGKEIETVVEDYFDAGEHSIEWEPKGKTNGMSDRIFEYFYRLITPNYSTIKRLIIQN